MSDKDFLEALEHAQKMPELPDELQGNVPDLLASLTKSAVASRVATSPGRVPYGKEYNFTYHCRRFIIGKVSTGYGPTNKEEFEDQDDSEGLKEVMDMHLSAQAIISKKIESFLKDGTVVIWLEWMAPKTEVPRDQRNYLVEAELRSPELPDQDSDNSEEG